MNNIPADYRSPSRFRFGFTLDIEIEGLSKPNIKLLLKSRKLIISQYHTYPFNVLPSLCLIWLWKEYIHCWSFSSPLLWNVINVCILYYCILCYCMYSILYYQYHTACPRNQTDQICHAQWGCSIDGFGSNGKSNRLHVVTCCKWCLLMNY